MSSIKKLEALKDLSFRLKNDIGIKKVNKDFFDRMEKEMIERRKKTEEILDLITMSKKNIINLLIYNYV